MRLYELYSKDNNYFLQYMKTKNDSIDIGILWDEFIDFLNNKIIDSPKQDKVFNELKTTFNMHDSSNDDIISYLSNNDNLAYKISPDIVKLFAKYFDEELYYKYRDDIDFSTRNNMDLRNNKLIKRTTWLVHFSNDAYDIAKNGFKYGSNSFDDIALTTAYNDRIRKSNKGYNFAFLAKSDDASSEANNGNYGDNFVLFQNSGIETYHYGDEETQIVFYGPDVDPRDIIYVEKVNGEFQVEPHPLSKYKNESGEDMHLPSGDYEDIVSWIIKNIDQYRKILKGR